MKKYKRMNQNDWMAGVLSGVAYYFGIQTWIVRLAFILIAVFGGMGNVGMSLVLIYIAVALVTPEYENDPDDYKEICE